MDFPMCRNTDCPLRWNCYRYRAKAKEHYEQVYGDFHPMGDGVCPDFLDCSEYVESRLEDVKQLDRKWRYYEY